MDFSTAADSRFPRPIGWLVRFLIVYSVTMFLVEVIGSNAEHSRQAHPFFLWSERVVAVLFTAEYIARIKLAKGYRWKYVLSGFGIIDLISIVPFWVGFFVPTHPELWLGLVRACRVFRLLKLVRYLPRVQLLFRALISCWNELLAVGFVCMIIFLFGAIAVWEVERFAQPDKFGNLGNAMWWMAVSLTTIGYGDVSPITPIGKGITCIVMIFGLGMVAGWLAIIVNVVSHVFSPLLDLPEELRDPSKFIKQEKQNANVTK